ncbi:unnamed protein product [Angiostrongylus costaricensis]|uniref:Neur_chan_memb domain-containing protein n=1 Tax=Angiostrongylus costaricensis TaxID=334426 RepID=A0A0R3PNY2_ANGCS|nr:unnamed protein product [Angiostrongylus costaricensis]
MDAFRLIELAVILLIVQIWPLEAGELNMLEWGWAKWLTVSTIVIGSITYMGYLVTPDWREIVDSKHYYSNWKGLLFDNTIKSIPSLRKPISDIDLELIFVNLMLSFTSFYKFAL